MCVSSAGNMIHCRGLRLRKLYCTLICVILLLSLVYYLTSRHDDEVYIAVVEEHHEVLPYWFDGVKEGFIPRERVTVFHVDGHADEAAPEYEADMPFFQWPESGEKVNAMMQKNDIFIQNWKQQNLYLVETAQCEGMVEVEAARYEQTLPTTSPSIRPVKTAGTQRVKMSAMVGFIGHFIWLVPSWVEDDGPRDETVRLGYFKHKQPKGKSECYFCECRIPNDPSQGDGMCLYMNYTDIDTEPETEIEPKKCIIKESYRSEIVFEDDAYKQLKRTTTEDGYTSMLGDEDLLLSNVPLIWDIDLDYFGCSLPGDILVKAGMTWRVVELIDSKLDRLFCPGHINHELHSDIILKRIINDLLKGCTFNNNDKCSEDFKVLQKRTEEIIILHWRNYPQLFCPQNDLQLRNAWKDIAFIIYHLTFKQIQALLSVGFCFNLSPKTYGAGQYMAVHICHGLNAPDSKFVQKYEPTLTDISDRLERLEHILSQLPPPRLVTLCRSSRDGYVPRQHAGFIERRVIDIVNRSQKSRKVTVLYDDNLLGGPLGWSSMLDLGNDAGKIEKWN